MEARIFFSSQYQIQQRESICARLRGLHIQHKHQEQNRELVIMKMIIMLFTSTFNISFITEITKIDKELKSFPLPPPKLQKSWQAMIVLNIRLNMYLSSALCSSHCVLSDHFGATGSVALDFPNHLQRGFARMQNHL